ncbi:MAG TPA: cytochrome c biogenesis protein ResB, partial [Phycisphaerae bacterium]|nr:cytochrome c biogenesis protein ResB [Phycisphaerae bacterium]
ALGDNARTADIDLDASVSRSSRPVDLTSSTPVILDGLTAAIERFLPDSEERTQVVNNNPREQIAVEVVLAVGEQDMRHWVFPDDASENEGSVTIKLRPVESGQEVRRFLATRPASQPASEGTVKVEYEDEGKTYEFSLEQCMGGPVPVGQTGYSLRVLRYLPHAVVGQDRQITNASSQPINPAVEVEIIGPKGTTKQMAFSRFPDFQMMHRPDQQKEAHGQEKGIKIRFSVSSQPAESRVPVEIYAARSGELGVQFTPQDGRPEGREISLGQVVETPWPGITFAVRERFDHARIERLVTPVEPIRENAIPAILVAVTTARGTERIWLRKGDSRTVMADDATCRLAFTSKTRPLGFRITLDHFTRRDYPGTQRPRSFESQVTFLDPSTGRQQSHVISMNRPATHGGFTFFQSSYREQEGGPATSVLSVSWDPGKPGVFAGYVGMVLGMVWVLVSRLIGRRNNGSDSADALPQGRSGT